jgi:hypothetical protein
MKRLIFAFVVFCSFALNQGFAQAQTLGYGFKAGLSLSKFDGPSEMSNGNNLEKNDYANGFFVGAIFRYWFTDLVGIKGELLYSQKGTDYNFDGPGYQILPTQGGAPVQLTGNQQININISNAYLDIPILAYGKFGKFEIEGGVNFGFLIASTGSGELNFNGNSLAGSPVEPFDLSLDYKYFKDNPGEVDFTLGTQSINVDGTASEIPSFLQANYLFSEDRGNHFNAIDIGLNAGLYYYWNQGLFIGGRLNYGLTDVTKSRTDVSRVALDANNKFIERDDKDRNISLQFSIGFSF